MTKNNNLPARAKGSPLVGRGLRRADGSDPLDELYFNPKDPNTNDITDYYKAMGWSTKPDAPSSGVGGLLVLVVIGLILVCLN